MDISQALEYVKQLYTMYIQPHIWTIAKIAAAVIIVIILLRIFLPMIWENILVSIIKISDKKNKNEKDDE